MAPAQGWHSQVENWCSAFPHVFSYTVIHVCVAEVYGTCTHMSAYTRSYTYACNHTRTWYQLHPHTCTYMHTLTHVCVCTYVCMYIYIYMYIHMYIYIYIHMHNVHTYTYAYLHLYVRLHSCRWQLVCAAEGILYDMIYNVMIWYDILYAVI